MISYKLFTGLLDCNLKEIYEGDKVKVKFYAGDWDEIIKEEIGIVNFDKYEGGYYIGWDLDELNKTQIRLTAYIACDTEII